MVCYKSFKRQLLSQNRLIYKIHFRLFHGFLLLIRYCRVGIYSKHERKEYVYNILNLLIRLLRAKLREDAAYIFNGLP